MPLYHLSCVSSFNNRHGPKTVLRASIECSSQIPQMCMWIGILAGFALDRCSHCSMLQIRTEGDNSGIVVCCFSKKICFWVGYSLEPLSLRSTHSICFCRRKRKIISELPLIFFHIWTYMNDSLSSDKGEKWPDLRDNFPLFLL